MEKWSGKLIGEVVLWRGEWNLDILEIEELCLCNQDEVINYRPPPSTL